jgi:hypothetical protein
LFSGVEGDILAFSFVFFSDDEGPLSVASSFRRFFVSTCNVRGGLGVCGAAGGSLVGVFISEC